jgi:hypothetical protein
MKRVTTLDMKLLAVVIFMLLARAASGEILDEKRLAAALQNLPQVRLDSTLAQQLVTNAIEASADDLDPLVLLAQQYIESKFDSTSTSRLIDGKRKTGPWASRSAPEGWTGNLYCGIGQNRASTWAACLALREPSAAAKAQAGELRRWLKRARGDLTLALAGYGCGNHGLRTGRCNRYPARVLARAARLHGALVVPMS